MTTEFPAYDDQANRGTPTRRTLLGALTVAPAAIGGLAAAAGSGSPLAELHRRLDVLKRRQLELSAAEDKIARAAGEPFLRIGKPGPGAIVLRTEADVDAFFLSRWHTAPPAERPARNAASRKAMKAQLAATQRDSEANYERLGGPAALDQLDQAEREIEETLNAIHRAPIAGIADLAIMLDVAIEMSEINITGDAIEDDAPARLQFTLRLLHGMMAQVPGFEFTSLRRDLLPYQYENLFAEVA